MIKALEEDVRNAYDEACAKYNDNKVDKIRFKKMYIHEIRQWVESETQKQYYSGVPARFDATIKVYKEWNSLEKM